MPPLFMSFQRFSLGQSVQNGGHARVYRPRRDLNRAIGLMLNSTAASYTQLDYARAINRRLSSCSRIGFHEAYARAPASGFSRERPRDRLVSYARYRASFSFLRGLASPMMLRSYSEDRENFHAQARKKLGDEKWKRKFVRDRAQDKHGIIKFNLIIKGNETNYLVYIGEVRY